jgi:mannosyltransferase
MKSLNRIYTFPSYAIVSGNVADAIKNSAWRYHIIGFLPIAALYLILGFYQINNQSLWTDEVISVGRIAADKPISTLLYSQSAVYFFLLDLWTQTAGKSEFALRSLSVLLGLAAVCLTYRFAINVFNLRTALFAAFLLATSPYLIWYAQEVRYVALLLVTSLGMTYSFHRALSTNGCRWWVLYSITSALGLFTFVTVGFLVIAHGLFLLYRRSSRALLMKWAASQVIVILVFASYFVHRTSRELAVVISKAPSITSHDQVRSRETLPVTDIIGTIPYTFYAFSVGFSLGPSLEELHVSRSINVLLNHSWTLVPTAVLFAFLFVKGLVRLRQEKDAATLLFLWLGVPIVGTLTVAILTTYHVYNTRYVAMALPAYILVLARAIAGFRRPRIQIGMLVSILCVNSLSLAGYYFNPQYAREDTRSAAQYLGSAGRPGELILVVGDATALRYYYKGELAIVRVHSQSTNNGSDVAENLQERVKNHHRLWLVEIRPWETDPKGNVKMALGRLYRLIQHKFFPGVNIYELSSDEIALNTTERVESLRNTTILMGNSSMLLQFVFKTIASVLH